MKKECETFVKKFLPVVKQNLAIILIKKYGFTQVQTANKLGVSQTAISLYLKKNNDNLNIKHKEKEINNLAKRILLGKDISKDMCILCSKLTHAKCKI
jgi:hypothetical protein